MTAAPMPRDTHVTTTVAGTGTNPPDRSPAAGGQGAPSHPQEGAPAPRRRNKSGELGTKTETAIARYLQTHGWPQAERRRLRGQADPGDITGTPGLAWSVKGGDAARLASDELVRKWLERADEIRGNVDADYGILITQRKGHGPGNCGRWWAHLWVSDLLRLHGCAALPWHDAPVRLHLAQLCAMLTAAGYGTPPDRETS